MSHDNIPIKQWIFENPSLLDVICCVLRLLRMHTYGYKWHINMAPPSNQLVIFSEYYAPPQRLLLDPRLRLHALGPLSGGDSSHSRLPTPSEELPES